MQKCAWKVCVFFGVYTNSILPNVCCLWIPRKTADHCAIWSPLRHCTACVFLELFFEDTGVIGKTVVCTCSICVRMLYCHHHQIDRNMIKIALTKFRRNQKTQHIQIQRKWKTKRKKNLTKLDTFCLLRYFFGSRWLLVDGNLLSLFSSSNLVERQRRRKRNTENICTHACENQTKRRERFFSCMHLIS